MKLTGQAVTVILGEGGREVLTLAGIEIPDFPLLAALIEESEDLGLWLRVTKERKIHFFLLRWDYIVGIDMQSGMGRLIGMRG